MSRGQGTRPLQFNSTQQAASSPTALSDRQALSTVLVLEVREGTVGHEQGC